MFFRLRAMRTRKLASDRQNEKNLMGAHSGVMPAGSGIHHRCEICVKMDHRVKPGDDEMRRCSASPAPRGGGSGQPAPTAFFRQARCTAQVQPGGWEVTSLA